MGFIAALMGLAAVSLSACGSSAPSDAGPAKVPVPTFPSSSGLQSPNFTDLKDLMVTVGGKETPLGESDVTYLRRTVAAFDDPATPGHDGIVKAIRDYLDCQLDDWSIGGQTFTVDLITAGVNQHDQSLVERGVQGVDWGVSLPIGADGGYTLTRDCDGKKAVSLGGTHTGSQWLEAVGRTVYLLRSSPWADQYESKIAGYITKMEEIADRQVANLRYWKANWMVDADGDLFTHKTYLMAAGLSLSAALTDDRKAARRWSDVAETVVRRGLDAQRPDGVNPERGGYDVAYQMYGTWLAELYDATLRPGPLKDEVERHIDRSIDWFSSRVDDGTGQVAIGDSTRICNPVDGNASYESADAVRVFLTWAVMHPDRRELVDRAVLMDRGAKQFGNPCP